MLAFNGLAVTALPGLCPTCLPAIGAPGFCATLVLAAVAVAGFRVATPGATGFWFAAPALTFGTALAFGVAAAWLVLGPVCALAVLELVWGATAAAFAAGFVGCTVAAFAP